MHATTHTHTHSTGRNRPLALDLRSTSNLIYDIQKALSALGREVSMPGLLAAPRALARAITRFVLALTLAMMVSQHISGAMPPPLQQMTLEYSAHSSFQPRSHALDGDLSAGVRVHRDGYSLDVWLVTPLSRHWNQAIVEAPPVTRQLAASGWLSVRKRCTGAPRFERIANKPPLSSNRLTARPMRRAFKV